MTRRWSSIFSRIHVLERFVRWTKKNLSSIRSFRCFRLHGPGNSQWNDQYAEFRIVQSGGYVRARFGLLGNSSSMSNDSSRWIKKTFRLISQEQRRSLFRKRCWSLSDSLWRGYTGKSIEWTNARSGLWTEISTRSFRTMATEFSRKRVRHCFSLRHSSRRLGLSFDLSIVWRTVDWRPVLPFE